MKSYGSEQLVNTVIRGGFCIGCGACAAVEGSPFAIELDATGCFQATIKEEAGSDGLAKDLRLVCPFADTAENEDQIGQRLFGPDSSHDPHLGYHLGTYAGYVAEGTWRADGSSGGMGKWILCELLREGMVDAVIEVKAHLPEERSDLIYQFRILHTEEEARSGSKSVYYPVEMSDVLTYVRTHPGRYAITGIPCFIKAVRLLSRQEPVFRERICFCIGLICGHLKSTRYAEMIGWQLGVYPDQLAYIDFRRKLPGARANEKGVEVRSSEGGAEVMPPDIVQNLFGTDYNHGFFQYNACDFCDDVVAETADITVGDAWLPEYLSDGGGTNVVITRNPELDRIVRQGIADQRLAFKEVSAEKVIQSQAGGFRQRREGLRYRLYQADQETQWRPTKRVKPSRWHLSHKRRKIYRLRTMLSKESHRAFQRALAVGDFEVFCREMHGLLVEYRTLYKPTFIYRIKRGIQRRVERLRRSVSMLS